MDELRTYSGLATLLRQRLRKSQAADPSGFQEAAPRAGWGTPDLTRHGDAVARVSRPLANTPRTTLSAAESRVFTAVEAIMAEMGGGYRVLAQPGLDETLGRRASGTWWRRSGDAALRGEYFDVAVMDADGRPVLALDYHGARHHRPDAYARDMVKREACRRAGVPFLEVEAGTTAADLRRRVRGMLAMKAAMSGR